MAAPTGWTQYLPLVIQSAAVGVDLTDWSTELVVCDAIRGINDGLDARAFVRALDTTTRGDGTVIPSDLEITDASDVALPWWTVGTGLAVQFSQVFGSELLRIKVLSDPLSASNVELRAYRGCTSPTGENSAGVVDPRTVAHYPFCGSFADLSSNGYNGTNSGAGWSASSNGRQGLEFIGSDYVSVPDAVADAIAADGTILVLWEHDGAGTAGHFFDGRQAAYEGWDFALDATPQIATVIDVAASGGDVTVGKSTTGLSAALHTGAGVYTGAAVLTYLDGSGATAAQSGAATRSASPVKLGNQLNNGDPLGAGRLLVELVVLNSALAAAEVSTWHTMMTNPAAFMVTGAAVEPVPAASGYRPWLITGGRMR